MGSVTDATSRKEKKNPDNYSKQPESISAPPLLFMSQEYEHSTKENQVSFQFDVISSTIFTGIGHSYVTQFLTF